MMKDATTPTTPEIESHLPSARRFRNGNRTAPINTPKMQRRVKKAKAGSIGTLLSLERIMSPSRHIITVATADLATFEVVLVARNIAALAILPAWRVARPLGPGALLTVLAGIPFAGMSRDRQSCRGGGRQKNPQHDNFLAFDAGTMMMAAGRSGSA